MNTTRDVMGMPITITVVSDDDKGARTAIETAFTELVRIDNAYSPYKPTSLVAHINDGSLALIDAPLELRDIVTACSALTRRTNGYFTTEIRGRFDPSGYVKGWAIQRALKLLTQHGFTNCAVTAGGDVQTSGLNSDGKPWSVGIRDPRDAQKIVKTIYLSGNAMATSGTYERGNHIVNPKTGKPPAGIVSLSVIGPDIIEADALATAAFAMGSPGLNWIAEHTDLAAFMITDSFEAVMTPNFSQFTQPRSLELK